jgi:hypothetical protein
MPSIVGAVKIISVGSSGVVQFGDTLQVSPQSSNKTYAGSGSFLTGDFPKSINAINKTNTWDPDVQDSTQDNFSNQGII